EVCIVFFFSSRRRHTRFSRDWSSDVCSSDLIQVLAPHLQEDLALGVELEGLFQGLFDVVVMVVVMVMVVIVLVVAHVGSTPLRKIGRASCRERVSISVVTVRVEQTKENRATV